MKISIITVAYNSAATLKDTFESVLAQTYENFEYILVDSASTDGTPDLIAAYTSRFGNRLRYICEPDRGAYDAMNKGIAAATGDVIGILNSDDFYTSPQVLATVAETLQRTGADAVYGDIHYVSPKDLRRPVRYYSSRKFTPERMRMGFMPAHPSFYCKAEVYRRYGNFDLSYKVASDFEHLLRLLYVQRISTAYIPLDFVTMRTGGLSNAGWRSRLQIMKDHRRALRANGVKSSYLYLALRYFYKIAEVVRGRFCYFLGR